MKTRSNAVRCRTILVFSVAVFMVVGFWGWLGGSAVGAMTYPYLPGSLNEEADLSVAEYAAVRLTAYYNCPGSLSSKLVRQSARCFLGPDSVDLFVDTLTQPHWDTYVSGSRFSVSDDQVARAYAEAGDVAMDWLRRFFPGVDEEHMRIVFSIRGYQIGVYSCGEFVIAR